MGFLADHAPNCGNTEARQAVGTARDKTMTEPAFTLGIEEEYLLVDTETFELAHAPDALMQDCAADLAGQVSPEFLQCQIEIGTGVY